MTCDVSWLRLERYVLGDLAEAESTDVQAHVGTCAMCQRHLRTIEQDQRPMPVLDLPGRRAPWGLLPLGGLALAALALMVMRSGPPEELPGPHRRIKGGDLAITVVRERAGAVQVDPEGFRSGDRFRVRVTCPPGAAQVRLEVREAGAAAQMLAEEGLDCRNQVPVGDPFVLTGSRDMAVCVTLDAGDAPQTVCQALRALED